MKKPTYEELPAIDVNVHRRVLGFLNAARRPEDLMIAPQNEFLIVDAGIMEPDELLHHDEVHDHAENTKQKQKQRPHAEPLLERDLARRVLRARDDYNPLYGFRHIDQLQNIPGFHRALLDRLIKLFTPRFRGKWEVLYADAD